MFRFFITYILFNIQTIILFNIFPAIQTISQAWNFRNRAERHSRFTRLHLNINLLCSLDDSCSSLLRFLMLLDRQDLAATYQC